ncbi:putative G1/S-specific cyclin [Colletotrichum sublineola]|nr:putative G1/S-specific cyclin [Colletotrichum sublineola]
MTNILKRLAIDVWSPAEVLVTKRQKTAVFGGGVHQLDDEYAIDILRHLELIESETMPDSSLMSTEIRHMRPKIIQSLIVAHAMLGLLPQTLFLSVNLLDRFCCRQAFHGEAYYKLVACAALWIASKYVEEKDQVPCLRYIMCFVPKGCYKDERLFLRVEMYVLNVLDWRINHPTPYCFIQLLEINNSDGAEVRKSAFDACKVKLAEHEFMDTRPSVLARDCLVLARNGSPNTSTPRRQI